METFTSSSDSAAEKPKLCINCAFCGTNSSQTLELYKCFAPENFEKINLLDGSKVYKVPYCKEARYGILTFDRLITYCGDEGKWFKPKPVYEPETVASYKSTPVKVNLKKLSGDDLANSLGM